MSADRDSLDRDRTSLPVLVIDDEAAAENPRWGYARI